MAKRKVGRLLAAVPCLLAVAGTARAGDEIQVYNAEINPPGRRFQEVFIVADYSGPTLDLDFGIGRGLTSGSDDWTVKFILGWAW